MSALPSRRLDAHAADDYAVFCEAVKHVTGVDLGHYKRPQMERRIRSFASRRGIDNLRDYAALVTKDDGELNAFLDRMTINVSQLWRNPEQWALLERTVLPELAEKDNRLRIWSAGCSYGAEVYTLAAVALEAVPSARVEVLGTDLDRRVIERARDGAFDRQDTRTAPPASLERWFEPVGDWWRASDELRRVVRFELGDLLHMRVEEAAYDLVLCRNVVIYLNEETRDELHARLASSLRCGGYLMVGSTERVTAPASVGLTFAHPFTYRKR